MSTDAVSTLVIFIESMRSPLARRARSGSRPLRPLAALARGRVPSVRSLRSLGVASPLSARCARVRISPLRGSARTPALGEASGTLRSACASVGPPRRRQPGGSRRRRGGPIATVPCRRGKEKSWKRGQTPDVGMVPGRKDSGFQPIHL